LWLFSVNLLDLERVKHKHMRLDRALAAHLRMPGGFFSHN
jgi:hypothetical protein